MYVLKQSPEDFIVREIARHECKPSGAFALCILKKRNYTTQRAITSVAAALGKPVKYVSFAGLKDKNAVTEQYVAIKFANERDVSNLELKDIELVFVGYLTNHLSLGELDGNFFEITIRNLEKEEAESLKSHEGKPLLMPNSFGEQRFSSGNTEIGKLLVKGAFKEAIEKILAQDKDASELIKPFLDQQPTNFIEALRLLPRKQLKMYIHAYQSLLWNRMLDANPTSKELPLIGFGTEETPLVSAVLGKEGVTTRDFVNRKMPELTSEGGTRASYVAIKDFEIKDARGTFAIVSFSLPKGSYATVAIAFLLHRLENTPKDDL
ncbi:MAG: tRNA pseudouridine(13) synthase TruD [Nanoarchaeota archaeon]|nr:tRNA pseudouridine(13) synthase TruD [Nanoarchaeota archaeon]